MTNPAPYIPPSWLQSLPPTDLAFDTTPNALAFDTLGNTLLFSSGLYSGVLGFAVLPNLPGQLPTVQKTAYWGTKMQRALNGRERALQQWVNPRWRFEVQYEAIRRRATNDELSVLWEFYGDMQASFGKWLFVDPSDFTQATPIQFGTGDGVTTTFTLTRSINSFVEPIFAPYLPAVTINGAATILYTLGVGGQIVFNTPPAVAANLSWSGYFYFGCRFDADSLDFEQMVSGMWTGKKLSFRSIRH